MIIGQVRVPRFRKAPVTRACFQEIAMRQANIFDDDAESNAAGPVVNTARLVSLDILRGVAILGILVMNIYAFAMPFVAYSDPTAMGGTEPHNLATWFFTHFFFDQKFLSIFAMLFGAGIVLMTGRAEQAGRPSGRFFFRRQVSLLVLGLLHAYLLWAGDILFAYAVVGMLVYPFRKLAPRTLIVSACLLLPVTVVAMHSFSYAIEDLQTKAQNYEALVGAGETLSEAQQKQLERWYSSRSFMAPEAEDMQVDISAYQGSYAEILAYRAPVVIGMQQGMLLLFSWRIGALMLIGMALMKLGVVSGQRSAGFYKMLMFAGYGLGLPVTMFSGVNLYMNEFDPVYVARYGMAANYFASIFVALGHTGLVMLVIKSGLWRPLTERFAAVGRMALTNYLMHSVLLTTMFYGYGFGLYGQLPRISLMGLVVIVIGLQLQLSSWWLRQYRFGPVEWLLRSVTYWRWQPLRREIFV
jgi:uncharacterized protein